MDDEDVAADFLKEFLTPLMVTGKEVCPCVLWGLNNEGANDYRRKIAQKTLKGVSYQTALCLKITRDHAGSLVVKTKSDAFLAARLFICLRGFYLPPRFSGHEKKYVGPEVSSIGHQCIDLSRKEKQHKRGKILRI